MRADERAPALYRVLHAVVPPIVNMFYRPWTEGVEHIPERGPAILASNHLSFLDSVFLPAACERPIYFLGKSDYFKGSRRWFFESVGVMPVNREGGDAGEASLRRGQEILDHGTSGFADNTISHRDACAIYAQWNTSPSDFPA
jgi:1-acyl-sn-glycerol-3-phosphate acyltransferase